MTNVNITKRNGNWEIKITGHTREIAEDTPNIVCAAVSMLAQTAVQTMRNAQERGVLKQYYDEIAPGDITILIKPKPLAQKEIFFLLTPIKIGFELLSSTYPDQVVTGWGNNG